MGVQVDGAERLEDTGVEDNIGECVLGGRWGPLQYDEPIG